MGSLPAESQAALPDAPARPRRLPRGLLLVGGVLTLAVVELANALWAPHAAPKDADWQAAAAVVRAGFRAGDLIVASPPWADPVLRLWLGDLMPEAMVGRMDDARYGRVWQIAQRGARAREARGDERDRQRFGALTVSRYERPAAEITYDFLERWPEAQVSREEGPPGQPPTRVVPCVRDALGFTCPGPPAHVVRPGIYEIGATLRRGLSAPPVANAAVVLTWANVPLGRELAFAGGLHHVWLRKWPQGIVQLRVLVDGQLVATQRSGNRTGFQLGRADTSRWAGQKRTVRFEITADVPDGRMFDFVAEARNP